MEGPRKGRKVSGRSKKGSGRSRTGCGRGSEAAKERQLKGQWKGQLQTQTKPPTTRCPPGQLPPPPLPPPPLSPVVPPLLPRAPLPSAAPQGQALSCSRKAVNYVSRRQCPERNRKERHCLRGRKAVEARKAVPLPLTPAHCRPAPAQRPPQDHHAKAVS